VTQRDFELLLAAPQQLFLRLDCRLGGLELGELARKDGLDLLLR